MFLKTNALKLSIYDCKVELKMFARSSKQKPF